VPNFRLTLEYDGSDFAGWQLQAGGVRTLQGELEAAIERVCGARVRVYGAGRTDAGVHALGQVASVLVEFALPADAVQRALNARLPADIRAVGVEDAPEGFHAQHDAVGKSYRYRIATAAVVSPFERWFVWHAPEPRDLDAMRRAARAFVGRHDFASFQPAGALVHDTVRTIHRLEVRDMGGEIVIDVDGDGFLRHMVRTLVGTLMDVGAGLRAPDSMAAMLAARDRRAAGQTAPAHGLTLVSVRY
jgi:tRNA pseudouridine38-40 synthase